jgi:GNAT superfamily N-acetyltransferase
VTPRRVDPAAEPATLDAMDVVMQQAYGASSFRTSIDRFVAVQPDGLFVVEEDDRVVGTGCCIAYVEGGFGWIGLVATAPTHQRRGIATTITEHLSGVLAEHGCASVLDASAAGAPVYERMGFDDHGLTTVMGLEGEAREFLGSNESTIATTADLDDIVEFDAVRFGSPRPGLLAALMGQNPGRVLILRRGAIVGYAVGQDRTLGPVVADDPDALAELVVDSLHLSWVDLPRINVPPESAHLDTLRSLGFETRRELRHMRRGIADLPGRRSSIAAQASLGEG